MKKEMEKEEIALLITFVFIWLALVALLGLVFIRALKGEPELYVLIPFLLAAAGFSVYGYLMAKD